MSRVFVSELTGAVIHVFAEDHCPPHVHARHRGEGWIARVGFSFVGDAVALVSLAPTRSIPLPRVVNRLLDEVRGRLADCRGMWWTTMRTTCLDNRWAAVAASGAIVLLAKRGAGAQQIVRATCDPATDRMLVVFRNGASLEPGGET